jgi:hypothetical protein
MSLTDPWKTFEEQGWRACLVESENYRELMTSPMLWPKQPYFWNPEKVEKTGNEEDPGCFSQLSRKFKLIFPFLRQPLQAPTLLQGYDRWSDDDYFETDSEDGQFRYVHQLFASDGYTPTHSKNVRILGFRWTRQG